MGKRKTARDKQHAVDGFVEEVVKTDLPEYHAVMKDMPEKDEEELRLQCRVMELSRMSRVSSLKVEKHAFPHTREPDTALNRNIKTSTIARRTHTLALPGIPATTPVYSQNSQPYEYQSPHAEVVNKEPPINLSYKTACGKICLIIDLSKTN